MALRRSVTALAVSAAIAISLTSCDSSNDSNAGAGGTPTPRSSTEAPDPAGDLGYDKAALAARVADYKDYVVKESETMITATKVLTDAIRAGDIAKAKANFALSRYHWETIEPIAGLVSSVDGAVDSRVDDFASVNDPAFSGWHRLEYMLWVEKKLTPLSTHYATLLDKDLKPLPGLLEKSKMTAKDVAQGAGGLIEEVSEGKLTGEEDRYSHTDLYDLAANVNGSFRAFQTYEPMLVTVDKPLELKIEQAFLDSKALLGKYQHKDGSYEPFTSLTKADKLKLQAILAGLSENLSKVAGTLQL